MTTQDRQALRRQVIIRAAELAQRFMELQALRRETFDYGIGAGVIAETVPAKSNPNHDPQTGQFAPSGARSARRGNRAHQSPEKVRGPEHATALVEQARERRGHARDVKAERRRLRREQQTERNRLKRRQEGESSRLDRSQEQEAARLTVRHAREAAKHPGSRALDQRHRDERSELEATHRQEREDLASEHRADRRSLREEHRDQRASQREDHLASITELRATQRTNLSETLQDVRSQREFEREQQEGKSLEQPTAAVMSKDADRDVPEAGGEEANEFDLPRGDDIAALLRKWFRRQMRRVLGTIPSIGEPLPEEADLPDLAADDARMAHAFTPIISAYWQDAGDAIRAKIGLEGDAWEGSWRVTDPHVRDKIERATFAFCSATNSTTSLDLATALRRLREEFAAGIVDEGEAIPALAKRFQRVFDMASKSRAVTIARTEASRATHLANLESVRESKAVTAKRLLLSSHACEVCHKVKASEPEDGWPLEDNMAVIGDHSDYAEIPCPPIHSRCRCSMGFVTLYD